MNKKIYFDMDGTIANLYGIDTWLEDIINSNPRPYEMAKPMVNMSVFARYIHKVQAKGYEVGIISWLAKGSTKEYDEAVAKAKAEWLARHLPSVEFNQIIIVEYGSPKSHYAPVGSILFDDEEPNRNEWKGQAYDQNEIMRVLKTLA